MTVEIPESEWKLLERWQKIGHMSDHDLSHALEKAESAHWRDCQDYADQGELLPNASPWLLCLREAACLRLRRK